MAPSGSSIARPRLDPLGLLWTLVRTEFKVRYHGTALGFVWALLKPTAMVLVMAGVFSLIFRDEPHYKLQLLVGLFLWDFFAEATRVGLVSLHQRAHLVAKMPFPRWIAVVTSYSNALITLAVVEVATLVVLSASGAPLSFAGLLLFGGYLVSLFFIVTGISLGASVLFLKFRDLNQVWEVMTQAGFFLAPIVYPLGALPERLHFLLYLWPPTPIIQFSRAVLIDGTIPSLRAHLFLALETAVLFGVGLWLYRRHSPRIAENL